MLKRLIAALLACVAGAAGVAEALRLAWADRLGQSTDPRGWVRAARLDGRNPEWPRRMAECLGPASAAGARMLAVAAQREPANASLRVALGLSAEMRGDLATAERELLRAAADSRLYEPRWTLANFYLRRGSAEPFWQWVRQALEISYGDRAPLFRLCWRMNPDGSQILARALSPRRDLLRDYASFLLAEKRLPQAGSLAERLAATAEGADRDVLLAVCDALLAQHLTAAALSIWNGMCQRHILPYPPLDPVRGSCLTNGKLVSPPAGAGFDWRLAAPPGTALQADTANGELRVTLSGRQPELCVLFWQYTPVLAGSRYRLEFEYRTEELDQRAGLRWSALDDATGAELAGRDPPLGSPGWKADWTTFTVPLASVVIRLGLEYQRQPGTVRAQGSLWLRNLNLRLLP